MPGDGTTDHEANERNRELKNLSKVLRDSKAIANVQKDITVAKKASLIISILKSGRRVPKAIYGEVDIDHEIRALEVIVDCLKKDLQDCPEEEIDEKMDALKFIEVHREDARECKRNPGKKTALTDLCIHSEQRGNAEGGAGSVAESAASQRKASAAEESDSNKEDGFGTKLHGSLIRFGDEDQGKVLDVDANFSVGTKGLDLGAGAALLQVEGDDGGFALAKAGANCEIGAKGIDIGAEAAVLQIGGDDSGLALGKAGGKCEINSKGVDVGVEAKALWVETESEKMKFGTGLNVDTGFQANDHGVQASILGFGFSTGDDGFGLKLPFLSVKWKK